MVMQFRGQPWADQDSPTSHLWDILHTSTLDSLAILGTSWASGNLLSGSCWGSPAHIKAPSLGHLGLIEDLSKTKMQVILESSCAHQQSINIQSCQPMSLLPTLNSSCCCIKSLMNIKKCIAQQTTSHTTCLCPIQVCHCLIDQSTDKDKPMVTWLP